MLLNDAFPLLRAYLFALVADLHEGAFGAGLGHLEVSLSAGGDTVVAETALFALIEQRAFTCGPERSRATARRDTASAARSSCRGAGLRPTRGWGSQVQPVGSPMTKSILC